MYLNCHVTSHDHLIWGVMQIYWQELLAVCHGPDKFCDHKHCHSGGIIYQAPSRKTHVEMVIWFYVRKRLTVSHRLAMFGGHSSSVSGDIMYLICHLTSQNHKIDGSSNFMSWSSSWYVTTLQRSIHAQDDSGQPLWAPKKMSPKMIKRGLFYKFLN